MAKHRLALLLAILLAPLVLYAEPAESTLPEELHEKLKDAIEAQQFGEDVSEDVKAKIIKEAPEDVLPSGTGDVSTTGGLRCAHSRRPTMHLKEGQGFASQGCIAQLGLLPLPRPMKVSGCKTSRFLRWRH